jgi:4-hydroxybenzoyl-CoA thioesterase
MSKTTIYTVRVEFGDCDPAGIVWFPNFFRWIDAASRDFFFQCGVPRWEETARTIGVIGTPLVDTHSRFLKTASYGDTLQLHVTVKEWRDKSFVQTYRIERAGSGGAAADLIMECEEVRIFAARRDDGKNGIRAVPIPESIRLLCD